MPRLGQKSFKQEHSVIKMIKMDFVKAKEILNAVEKLNPDSKNTIISALDVAEHFEAASKAFYEEHARKNKGNSLEHFFNFLVKEENMHLEKILELKKMVKNGVPAKINFPHNIPPRIRVDNAGEDETSALLFALWREKKAVEFYSGAEEKTRGPIKQFFHELAEFEREHVHLFENNIEKLNTDDDLMLG
jgi:rubrerythrin